MIAHSLRRIDDIADLAPEIAEPVARPSGLPINIRWLRKSFGANEAIVMRNAATNVTELVLPHAGHWLMEEQTDATVSAVKAFLSTGQ